MNKTPNLKEFLNLSKEDIIKTSPKTVILSIGGTRRALALAGKELSNLGEWTRPRMLKTCCQFFRYGTKNLIVPIARPQQFAEAGYYGKQLIEWINIGIAGKESLDFYNSVNWRVRLTIAGNKYAFFEETIETLDAETEGNTGPNVWFLVVPNYEELWHWQISAFMNGAKTRKEAIKYLFGEDLPVAELLLSFGKPMISLDILPPILYDELQCYWMQKPGYDISDTMLRKILYDYAYTRNTWQKDKSGRADKAIAQRAIWEQDQTLGLGIRLGPFWYPAPFKSPDSY